LVFAGLWKKRSYFWKFGLKEQQGEKIEFEEAIMRRRIAIDHSAIELTKGDRTHLCMKPTPVAALFWKFLILGF
jgi:hypothetical protein